LPVLLPLHKKIGKQRGSTQKKKKKKKKETNITQVVWRERERGERKKEEMQKQKANGESKNTFVLRISSLSTSYQEEGLNGVILFSAAKASKNFFLLFASSQYFPTKKSANRQNINYKTKTK
jgi:hypothetical protein